jgi:hypothetical protein
MYYVCYSRDKWSSYQSTVYHHRLLGVCVCVCVCVCSVYIYIYVQIQHVKAGDKRRNQKPETARPIVRPHIHSRQCRCDSFAFHVLMAHAGKRFYPRRTTTVTETNRQYPVNKSVHRASKSPRTRHRSSILYRDKSQLYG